MEKWSCERCGRIMTEVSACDQCSSEEVKNLVTAIHSEDQHLPGRVTEVLDSSQFNRNQYKKKQQDIDAEIDEFAIQSKAEEMSNFDAGIEVNKEDIFEETCLEGDGDATLFLSKDAIGDIKNTKEATSPTIFIPTDSEIRQAFGEAPMFTSDETFINSGIDSQHFVSEVKKEGSLPHVGGSALAKTRSQDEAPSHFQHSDVIGSIFGRCRVLEKISEGAMGRVYKAYHQTLDKMVVLKELPPSLASSQELRERFIREAKACARIHHQNVVQVLDAGYENGVYFYIMEYVDGATLEDLLRSKKKFPLKKICGIIRDAAKGLEVAHREGVVHRDIKASNIMVTKSGEVKVADFGLACDLSSSKISVAGQIMGTPQYMSPEQWDGAGNVDERSDLYSLGVTFYYFLAERLPFDSGSTVTLFKQHVSEKPPALKDFNRDIPIQLIKIVNRLLEKDRNKRYQSAQNLIEDLDIFLYQKKQENSSNKKIACVIFLLFFVAGGFYAYIEGYTKQWYLQTKSLIGTNTPQDKTNATNIQTDQTSVDISQNSSKEDIKDTVTNQETQSETTAKIEKPDKVISEETTHTSDNSAQIETENDNTETTEKNQAHQNKQEVIVEKEIVLPHIQVLLKKQVYNSFPIVIKGKITGSLTSDMRVTILLQKDNQNFKKLRVSVKNTKFIAILKKLDDAKYNIIPYVVYKNQKKRIGKVHNITVDTTPPNIRIIASKEEQIFYEEQGNQVELKFQVKDFSTIKKISVQHNNNEIQTSNHQDIYTSKVNMSYGKQIINIRVYDQVENMGQLKLSWILVPKGMIRIPGGSLYLQDKQIAFKTFYIDKKEVTNREYKNYLEMSNAQAPPRWGKDSNDWENKPVVFVNYDEATTYAKFAKKRLPTEIEWIIAALWNNNTLQKYPWGNEEEVAWPEKISSVGNWQKDISFFGIHDMAGNVSEWVQDVEGEKAIRKGGNFTLAARYLKRLQWDKAQFHEHKSSRKNWLGFRCAFSE